MSLGAGMGGAGGYSLEMAASSGTGDFSADSPATISSAFGAGHRGFINNFAAPDGQVSNRQENDSGGINPLTASGKTVSAILIFGVLGVIAFIAYKMTR